MLLYTFGLCTESPTTVTPLSLSSRNGSAFPGWSKSRSVSLYTYSNTNKAMVFVNKIDSNDTHTKVLYCIESLPRGTTRGRRTFCLFYSLPYAQIVPNVRYIHIYKKNGMRLRQMVTGWWHATHTSIVSTMTPGSLSVPSIVCVLPAPVAP